jgi:hypothetical protein
VQQGVPDAGLILPIVFVAIFGTVLVYGLTGVPVARRLGVAGEGGTLVLVVGGHAWARAVADALRAAGVGVRLWTGDAGEQSAARAAGFDADQGRMMVDAVSREAELEEVTDAVLLTGNDDFNAIAAAELRVELGHDHVYRLAPGSRRIDLLPPHNEAGLLPSYEEMERGFAAGARIVATAGDRLSLAFTEPDGATRPAGAPPAGRTP